MQICRIDIWLPLPPSTLIFIVKTSIVEGTNTSKTTWPGDGFNDFVSILIPISDGNP